MRQLDLQSTRATIARMWVNNIKVLNLLLSAFILNDRSTFVRNWHI